MKQLFLMILVPVLVFFGCDLLNDPGEEDISYGSENGITILNPSFESPAGLFGNKVDSDAWVAGGSWYGRFQYPDGVADGAYAVWSSVYVNGSQPELGQDPENGFSQELVQVFEVGRYTLNIKALGDNTAGLTSRLILGYDTGNDSYTELDHDDLAIAYDDSETNFTHKGAWQDQTLAVEIKEGSKAIGKPILIRFSSTTTPTGDGGNSCWWDDIHLSVAYPL
ncbi:MAG: hypothetical protein JXI43_06910 [Tissierellales bacterium]|nr:hypothetical protein [Tissierellales bacterium]